MAAQGNKLHDELLPEIELSVVPSKLSETIRVDLYRLPVLFAEYLLEHKIIAQNWSDPVDVVEMPLSKFPNFCVSIRDAYSKFKVLENADI